VFVRTGRGGTSEPGDRCPALRRTNRDYPLDRRD
jgi:hypothetical protein